MTSRRFLLFGFLAVSAWAQYVPVHEFDPGRDAAKDIRQASAEAARTGKRVLVEVGGQWCSWCHRMDAFFQQNTQLRTLRDDNFVTVKVNFSRENENRAALSKYPAIPGYPHLFVLDGSGRLLHSQNTADLESGATYNADKIRAFLREWAPKR